MDGPRAIQMNELDQVISFLNENLRPDQSWTIDQEYPEVFNSKNTHNIQVVTDNENILSHAAIKFFLIKTPFGLFKTAAIGSVVTDPNHRNKGLSQSLLEKCIASAKEQQADFAILWTDLFNFYRKLGFELAGTEMSIIVDKNLLTTPSKLKFMDTLKIAPESILNLYSKHTVGSIRTVQELNRYLKIPNTKLYTAWDNNQLLAYAVEGKGADLNGYIHEWGGGVSHLVELFDYIYKSQKKPITIISPDNCSNLIRTLKDHHLTVNTGYLGMIKILNTKNLFSKIVRHARSLGENKFIFLEQDNEYILGVKSNLFKTNSEQDVIQLIFGPHSDSLLNKFDPETKKIIQKVLPLPMWFWGWDSV
ncbi:MAG: GNAT family N-acetyltransferase [Bdellovibrionaceae bacterium]|jgi:predicted acetyltransferase|nr:GNAT family N-acetyltransferase [Pseudobdellovibrionaceae bacterium]